ncbi:transposase Tn3 family (plasmid) [Cupriavidus necator N-1]|uniref:Transposase Tn3 family n=1 Tax=Cupriavidus necator (strain ATCC 43291 / DSM 13513 / CCUG 52238 / LMG 8453 / N-1) TaxID=1042878 RepID=F8GYQ0_CUPNN|nr:transposase Tn3 family [Cupriavidus necator N-1]
MRGKTGGAYRPAAAFCRDEAKGRLNAFRPIVQLAFHGTPNFALASKLPRFASSTGPTSARSIKGLSRKQIAWLNLRHVTEQRIDKAIVKVINAYNQFALPKYWGGGKRASAALTGLPVGHKEGLLGNGGGNSLGVLNRITDACPSSSVRIA